jgi:hypothetical protein
MEGLRYIWWEDEDDNSECPVCGRPNSGGVPCSNDCFKADML